jgi:hypothetical protein
VSTVVEVSLASEPVVITPVVWLTNNPLPVVKAVSFNRTNVAAGAAVEDKSSKVPLVAPPVSIEVEEILTSDPVSAMTEVVWGIMNAVPVVKALAVMFNAVPVVRAAVVI